jgi:hypothetical protein
VIGYLVFTIVWAIICAAGSFALVYVIQLLHPAGMSNFVKWWALFGAPPFAVVMIIFTLVKFYWFWQDNIAPYLGPLS